MGVDVTRSPDPDLRASLRLRFRAGDGPLLVFAGRLVEEKGYADFLRALACVSSRRPDVSGLVVGDGQDRGAAERLARDLGVADRVHFAGWVESTEMPSYMAAGDVFVAPSRRAPDGWIEAQGLSVIEAMAVGVPVVASACGGIVDTIDDGISGLLVPERAPEALADAIERLVVDGDLRDRIVIEGRRVARDRFSLEATAGAFAALFRDVLDRPVRARRGGLVR
jgi:glycosyltransferase involved in cell wall biosynthesis